jgi:hypothetical protein
MQEYHQSRQQLLQLQTKHQQPKLAQEEFQAQLELGHHRLNTLTHY